MSTNRSRRIDRDTAEQLLGGAVGGPSAGQDASLTGPDASTGRTGVAHVLAAAAAPAVADELAGEEAALAAFREARLAPVPAVPAPSAPVRRRSMATAALARAFSTKAVAVVLGATALGGVAVAAGTGNLPSALGGGSEEPRPSLLAPATASSAPVASSAADSGSSTRRPSTGPSTTGPSTTGPSTVGPSAGTSTAGPSTGAAKPPSPGVSPSASTETRGQQARAALVALCQGYTDRKGKGGHPRPLVTDPQFAALVAAVGGPDKVDEYCGEVLRHKDDDDRQAVPSPSRPGSTDGGGRDGGKKDDGKTADGKNGSGGGGSGPGPLPTAVPTLPGVLPKPDRSGQSADSPPGR